MAKIVLGIGCSHTPLLTLTSEQWVHRAAADHANTQLNLSDGRLVTYPELLAEVGPRYADIVTPEILESLARQCDASLDRLGDALAEAAPDLVLVVGDDQRELFTGNNQPALAIYHGEQIVTNDKFGHEESPEWVRQMGKGYLMDEVHALPGDQAFALELIRGLIDAEFDIAALAGVEDPHKAGFGHAFGFIVKRLLRGRRVPVLPLLVNTYYGPNVPSAARCHDLGRALRRVIEASPRELRVAVVASGGLSHFVVDEALDRSILKAIEDDDHAVLRSIPRGALNSGSSEILNWVVTAGAMSGTPLRSSDYHPLYRTPAGTGVGAGFVIWG